MAEVAVPSISTAVPTDVDTVVGVQAGAVKRFSLSAILALVTPIFTTAARIVVPADGNKLWLAKYQTGTGHTDAPKTLGAASAYLQVGGREYGSTGFSGVGFGYVADPTQNPAVWVGHEEIDTAGNTTGDFLVATRAVTTNTAPVEQFRVTKVGAMAVGGKANVGAAGQVLTSAGPTAPPAWAAPQAPLVAADGKTAQTANVNVPALYAVPVSGMYRVSAFVALSQAATTSSTMPSVSVNYTEAITGTVVQDNNVTAQGTNNVIGTHSGGSAVILCQQGSNIGYVTSGYASVGATAMHYGVQVKIEFLG